MLTAEIEGYSTELLYVLNKNPRFGIKILF